MVNFPLRRTPLWLAVLCLAMSITLSARADSAAQIDRDVRAALQGLYAKDAGAKALGAKAVAVLVFPNIVKAGLVVGGQYGEGALLAKGKTLGYYSTRAVSYGMQAGAQTFGYAMFLMTEKAYQHVNDTNGWEIGTGPSIVVMDKGTSRAMTTTTYKDDIYVFFFDQSGLMLGLGLQGTKISRLKP